MPTHEHPDDHAAVALPVGVSNGDGTVDRTAEVRAVTALDEMNVGMSREYQLYPNDMVYKLLLLGRCVIRLGDRTPVSLSDIQALDARDIRALELAIYALTYGPDSVPPEAGGGGATR